VKGEARGRWKGWNYGFWDGLIEKRWQLDDVDEDPKSVLCECAKMIDRK